MPITMETTIEELGLSRRAINGLRKGVPAATVSIKTLGDLIQWPEKELLKIKGIARKTTCDIHFRLKDLGYGLKDYGVK